MLRVQFINLQTLDLSGNNITYIDNLRANKVHLQLLLIIYYSLC